MEDIQEMRRQLGWSQVRLAEVAQVSPSTVHRLESGADVHPATLRAVRHALGLDLPTDIDVVDVVVRAYLRVLRGDCVTVTGAVLASAGGKAAVRALAAVNDVLEGDTDLEVWESVATRDEMLSVLLRVATRKHC